MRSPEARDATVAQAALVALLRGCDDARPDWENDVSGYTICAMEDAPDFFGGEYPGEMRFFTGPLGSEQVAFSYRRMPQHTGGKGSYGHRHRTQEEIYFVMSGRLEFKLDSEVIELGPGTAVRVGPDVVRSVWNERPEDAELLIFSLRIDDPMGDVETVPDFWPTDGN